MDNIWEEITRKIYGEFLYIPSERNPTKLIAHVWHPLKGKWEPTPFVSIKSDEWMRAHTPERLRQHYVNPFNPQEDSEHASD